MQRLQSTTTISGKLKHAIGSNFRVWPDPVRMEPYVSSDIFNSLNGVSGARWGLDVWAESLLVKQTVHKYHTILELTH